ncbi:hypothetical protein [Methanopyrus kandleri]
MRYLAALLAMFAVSLTPAAGYPPGHPGPPPWCQCPFNGNPSGYYYPNTENGASQTNGQSTVSPGYQPGIKGYYPDYRTPRNENVSTSNPPTAITSYSQSGGVNANSIDRINELVSDARFLAYSSWPMTSLLGPLVLVALAARRR